MSAPDIVQSAMKERALDAGWRAWIVPSWPNRYNVQYVNDADPFNPRTDNFGMSLDFAIRRAKAIISDYAATAAKKDG